MLLDPGRHAAPAAARAAGRGTGWRTWPAGSSESAPGRLPARFGSAHLNGRRSASGAFICQLARASDALRTRSSSASALPPRITCSIASSVCRKRSDWRRISPGSRAGCRATAGSPAAMRRSRLKARAASDREVAPGELVGHRVEAGEREQVRRVAHRRERASWFSGVMRSTCEPIADQTSVAFCTSSGAVCDSGVRMTWRPL